MASTAPHGFQTPYVPLGWGGQYYPSSPTVSGFLYDIPNQILYTIYPNQTYDIWLQVPTSIAQQMTLAGAQNSSQASFPNPNTILTQQIKGVFPECILTENGAPLFSETSGGYLVIT